MACKTKTRRIRKMPIGGILGIHQASTGMGEGIRTSAENDYNQHTGEFNKPGKVGALSVVGRVLQPWRVLEKNGTMHPKAYVDSIENERKAEINAKYRQQYSNNGGGQSSQNIPLMPMGGLIPYNQESVELEKGEPFQTPDGQINKISDNAPTHAQGGVPITLPSGTRVLGKKPATDEKTFKQLGSKLEKQQTKYKNILKNKPSRIEEETATRMLDKVNNQFNELFELQQEDIQPNQQFPNGGLTGDVAADTVAANYRPQTTDPQNYGDFDKADYGDLLRSTPLYQPGTNNVAAEESYYKGVPGSHYIVPGSTNGRMEKYNIDGKTRFAGSEAPVAKFPNGGTVTTERGVSAPNYRNITPTTFNQQMLRKQILQPGYDTLSTEQINEQIRTGYNVPKGFAAPYQAIEGDSGVSYQKDYGRNAGEYYDPSGSGEVTGTYNEPRTTYATGGEINKSPYYFESQQQGFQQSPDYFETTQNEDISPINKPKFGSNINSGNTLGTIGALAPALYNLYQGMQKPDKVSNNSFKNPYESEVRATMEGRRYNIQPEIEANRLSEATYYRNLREGAPTQAQYLGGLQAGAISTQRANGQVLARKQNTDNQYLAEQAQVDMSLGQADSQRQKYIEDINSRSKAVQEQFTSTGLSQLGQYAQVRQQMNNQMIRDAQRLNLLPALVQNFQLNDKGQWVFKQTGEVVDTETVMEYVKGNNTK